MGKAIYTKTDERAGTKLPASKQAHAKQKHEPPVEEQRALVKLTDATRMLAEVRDAPSAKRLMDWARAAEVYARKFDLGEEAVAYAKGVQFDAKCRLGECLDEMPNATPGPKPELSTQREHNSDVPSLKEMGISRKLASEAQRAAQLPPETREAIKRGEIKESQALRQQKRATLSTRLEALPPGKFRVIYADPPWSYGDERAGLEKQGTAAAAQYPTMPIEDICDLAPDGRHVKDLAAADAVLFMWATFPLLEDALQVIDEWGFKYKTAIVWDKQRSNIGNYHDARAELLMIATRGSCPIEIDTRPNQVQSIARGRHSAKPEEFRALIDLMYPSGPRIELFRRGDVPANWKTWGNEASTEAA